MQKAFAVIANVDGNLDALRAVLADIDARDVTETLSLRNLVGTGLEPAACIARTAAPFPTSATSLTLYDGMNGMLENTFPNVKNQSKRITAKVEIPRGGANGVILAQGGRFGGWSLYMKDGRPVYTYNYLGLSRYTVAAPSAVPAGPVTVTLDFAYDGGGVGKGGVATLSVDGKTVAEGRIEKTQPLIFSADETADVGLDNQTPVAEGIGVGPQQTRFTGTIHKVTIEVR